MEDGLGDVDRCPHDDPASVHGRSVVSGEVSDESDVAEAARRFLSAVSSCDHVAVLSALAPEAQEQLVATARRRGMDAVDAEQAVRGIYRRWWTWMFKLVRVEAVTVAGSTAEVTYRHLIFGRDPEDDWLKLRCQDGRWLVAAFPDD